MMAATGKGGVENEKDTVTESLEGDERLHEGERVC
jgi:hypothetical protein